MLSVERLETSYARSQPVRRRSRDRRGEVVTLLGRNGRARPRPSARSWDDAAAGRDDHVRGPRAARLTSFRIAQLGLGLYRKGAALRASRCGRTSPPLGAGNAGDSRWPPMRSRIVSWIRERIYQMGGQLSGGAADAGDRGALMTNPELLILDEADRRFAPLIRNEI